MSNFEHYSYANFQKEAANLLSVVSNCPSMVLARERLSHKVLQIYNDVCDTGAASWSHQILRSRDCMQAFISIFQARADALSGFSVTKAMMDIAANQPRPDLQRGFFAEMINWIKGLEGRASFEYFGNAGLENAAAEQITAGERSASLDEIWSRMSVYMSRFEDGLSTESRSRRAKNKKRILKHAGANANDWNSWQWQTRHIITDADRLSELITLSFEDKDNISRARGGHIPFAVTPYYLSLLDDCEDRGRDRALRAQVIPPSNYVDNMLQCRDNRRTKCDFMLEADTSPAELVVRRYPGIVILKPCNTCPQICVYCQRNWEIEEAMSPAGLADKGVVFAAIEWIRQHPAIHEVLVTGGDPFIMPDEDLRNILELLASIPHVSLIRIGTRTPVTLPMRITKQLASMLGSFREPGKREIVIMTHIEHVYEITQDTAAAVNRLRCEGISVYNQQVYTFYVSRRFETTYLRFLLRRIGVDPYYTFVPKGKDEMISYRVPIARILQEQKEEARLVPGLSRTDEAVFNIPGMGKNYLRARQHRDLLSVMPNGARVYEFHPWEKNIRSCRAYIATDIPILDYLVRLEEHGENIEDYSSIWFYL